MENKRYEQIKLYKFGFFFLIFFKKSKFEAVPKQPFCFLCLEDPCLEAIVVPRSFFYFFNLPYELSS